MKTGAIITLIIGIVIVLLGIMALGAFIWFVKFLKKWFKESDKSETN